MAAAEWIFISSAREGEIKVQIFDKRNDPARLLSKAVTTSSRVDFGNRGKPALDNHLMRVNLTRTAAPSAQRGGGGNQRSDTRKKEMTRLAFE